MMRRETSLSSWANRLFTGLILALALTASGCATAARPRTVAGVGATGARALASKEASTIATVAEVRTLLAEFNMPEEPGDPGYALLSAQDESGWTRATVLAHTDFGRLVHSIGTEVSGVSTEAVELFDRTLASKGATATYDRVLDAEWNLEDKVTTEDTQFNELSLASTFMGNLFDRKGRLAGSYTLKNLSVSGDVAMAVYQKPGASDVQADFVLVRDSAGVLRIAGIRNYLQFEKALADTELTFP